MYLYSLNIVVIVSQWHKKILNIEVIVSVYFVYDDMFV